MKRNIRLLATLVAIALCVGLFLTACATDSNSGADTSNTTNNDTNNATTNNTDNTATTDEQITLKFWHIWGSGDPTSEAVAKVIADFQTANPNVKIEVETFENESYKTKIATDIPGGNAPDIFSAWGGGSSKGYVESGKILNLDSYLDDATRGKLLGGALNNVTYDGSVYGLTFGLAASGFFCNNRLFEENGVKIPETWDELMTAVETFNEKGITPIETSMKEAWVVGMLFEGLAVKCVGAEQTSKTLYKQEGGTFSDEQFKNAANRIIELIDKGAFNADANAISRNDAEVPVKAGEAAMYYMGSWAAGTLVEDDVVDKGNFTYIPFPTIPDGNGKGTEFNGGASDAIMISSNTAHPDEAAAFVKYFCENVAREGYLAGSYMPIWDIGQVDESGINPIMVSIKNATANATDFILWWDTLLESDDTKTYQTALDNLLNKQITVDEFIDELKKIQP